MWTLATNFTRINKTHWLQFNKQQTTVTLPTQQQPPAPSLQVAWSLPCAKQSKPIPCLVPECSGEGQAKYRQTWWPSSSRWCFKWFSTGWDHGNCWVVVLCMEWWTAGTQSWRRWEELEQLVKQGKKLWGWLTWWSALSQIMPEALPASAPVTWHQHTTNCTQLH